MHLSFASIGPFPVILHDFKGWGKHVLCYMIDVDNYLIPPVEKWFPAPVCIELEYIQGGPKKLAHCFVRANFIKY